MGSGGGYRAIAQAPKHREMAGVRWVLGEFVRGARFIGSEMVAPPVDRFPNSNFQGSTLSLAYAEVREFKACSSKVLIMISDAPRACHRASSPVRHDNSATRLIYNYNM